MEKVGIDLSIVTEFFNNIRKNVDNNDYEFTPMQLKILNIFNRAKNGFIELHLLDLPSNINNYKYFELKNFYKELKNKYNIIFPDIKIKDNSFEVEDRYLNNFNKIVALENKFLENNLFLRENNKINNARLLAYAHIYGINKIYSKSRAFNFNKDRELIYKNLVEKPVNAEQITNASGKELYIKKEKLKKVFLDTNAFFYYTKIYKKSFEEIKSLNDEKLIKIYNLFEDIKNGKVEAYSSSLVLQEINNSKKFINKDFYMIQSLKNKIKFLNFNEKDNLLTQKLLKTKAFNGKSKFDAAHLAVAINNQIDEFCTDDGHFDFNSATSSFINKICYNINKNYKIKINKFKGNSK